MATKKLGEALMDSQIEFVDFSKKLQKICEQLSRYCIIHKPPDESNIVAKGIVGSLVAHTRSFEKGLYDAMNLSHAGNLDEIEIKVGAE